jgi:hypothetical protein
MIMFNYRPLTRLLTGMSFEKFVGMLQMVYMSLLYVLQYTALVNSVIEGILSDARIDGVADSPIQSTGSFKRNVQESVGEDREASLPSVSSSTVSLEEKSDSLSRRDSVGGQKTLVDEMISESSEIVNTVADLCYMRCSKLISVRSEQNSRLNPAEFYHLFGSTWEFVCGGESINTGHTCVGLKSTMLSQAKSFLSFFHDERLVLCSLILPRACRMISGVRGARMDGGKSGIAGYYGGVTGGWGEEEWMLLESIMKGSERDVEDECGGRDIGGRWFGCLNRLLPFGEEWKNIYIDRSLTFLF